MPSAGLLVVWLGTYSPWSRSLVSYRHSSIVLFGPQRFRGRLVPVHGHWLASHLVSKCVWWWIVHFLRYTVWLDTVWVILKKKSDKQKFLFACISPCHGRSGLGISVSTCSGSETVGCGVFIISLTHAIMCTHYFVMPVGLRNPLKNHSIMWQIGQFYPCFFRANFVYGFLQQYQRNKGVTYRARCHNRNGRHSLWCVLSCKQRASKGAPKFEESSFHNYFFVSSNVHQAWRCCRSLPCWQGRPSSGVFRWIYCLVTLGGVAGRCLADKGDRRVKRAAQWPSARCCYAFAVLIMQPSAQ